MKDKIKRVLETYDKYSKVYADYTSGKVLQYQQNKLISLLPKKATILDLGCGSGRDVAYFLEENLSVVGIDVSKGMLKEAQSRVKNGVFKRMDMRDLKFKEKAFDGVWCMASLADVPKQEAPIILKNIHRVLKERGIVYIAVKEGAGEIVLKKERYNNAERFYAYYLEDELKDLLRMHGFEIIDSTLSVDNATSWVEIFARKK